METIIYFWFLLLLFLPTFIANAMPVVVKNIPVISGFKTPVNEKLFWKNKTYRGFVFWVLFAIVISLLEYKFIDYVWVEGITEKYYQIVTSYYFAILVWFIQWFWALLWDLMESFFKRRIWKKPWEALVFWDGADYIIASLILFSFIYVPSFVWIVFLVLFAPAISLTANVVAYLLGMKEVWY